jgi:hypothetical protein
LSVNDVIVLREGRPFGDFGWVAHLVVVFGAGGERVLFSAAFESVPELKLSVDVLADRVVEVRLECGCRAELYSFDLAAETAGTGASVREHQTR